MNAYIESEQVNNTSMEKVLEVFASEVTVVSQGFTRALLIFEFLNGAFMRQFLTQQFPSRNALAQEHKVLLQPCLEEPNWEQPKCSAKCLVRVSVDY